MAPGSAPRPERQRRRAAFQVELLEPRLLLAVAATDAELSPGAGPLAAPAQFDPASPADGGGDGVQAMAETGPLVWVVGPTRSEAHEHWDLAVEDAHTVIEARPGPRNWPVVPEAYAAHDQPDLAQPLPIAAAVGVLGTMAATDQRDMYRLLIGPGEHVFRFDIHMTRPPGASEERVSFYDRSGLPLDSFPIPVGVGEVSVIAHETGARGGSALYIAINRVQDRSAAGTIVTNDPYWLQITRLDPPGSPVPAEVGELDGAEALTPVGRPPTAPATAAAAPAGGLTLIAMPIGTRQAVVGTWPLASSGSAGGVLDSGRPIQATPSGDDSMLDLDLIDMPARPDAPAGPGAVDSGRFDPDARPVALRSAGGFPILGASRRGGRGLLRPILVGRPATPPAPLPVEDLPAEASEPRPTAQRLPLRAGLSIAAALALGLFLPDLAAVLGPAARWRSRPRAAGPRRTPSRAR